MPSNVEIKAKVKDFSSFLKLAEKVSGEDGFIINQTDTFFNCASGRLKLRCFKSNDEGQLIFYKRPDKSGPKLSEYSFSVIHNPDDLKNTLSTAYKVKGEVRKKRTLFMVGQTRIHADEVEGLGTFMELEVQMKDGQNIEEGQEVAKDLMEKLGVTENDLITGAYMDLILAKEQQNGH